MKVKVKVRVEVRVEVEVKMNRLGRVANTNNPKKMEMISINLP